MIRRPGKPGSMTLRQAMRIALENGELVRVISLQCRRHSHRWIRANGGEVRTLAQASDASPGQIVIAPLKADADPGTSRPNSCNASVEQVYWALAQAHVQLWAADRAVSLADEIFKRERAELKIGRGTPQTSPGGLPAA